LGASQEGNLFSLFHFLRKAYKSLILKRSMEIPKKMSWKKLDLSQKIIAIFGFLSLIFWIIAYIYQMSSEKERDFFNETSMIILFVLGWIGLISFIIRIALFFS